MIPSFFVYPRVHYKEHFIGGGPVRLDGDANPSGWMKEDNFQKLVKHFKEPRVAFVNLEPVKSTLWATKEISSQHH